MRFIPAAATILLVLASATGLLRADDATNLPEAVYIDPAEFLPEAFGQTVEEMIEDVPLTDVVPIIAELSGMPTRVVEHHLERGLIPLDITVTLRGGMPLYMSLDRMCSEAVHPDTSNRGGIAWVVDRGILNITTQMAASDWKIVRTYDIGDLLQRGDDEAQVLIDLIQNHAHLAEWVDIDGIGGEIDLLGNLLVINQTFAAHRKIAAILSALRTDARTIYVDRPPGTAAIDAAFHQTIDGSFDGVALGLAMRDLSDQTGVEVSFDPIWVKNDPAQLDARVNYSIVGQDLKTTLDLMFESQRGEDIGYFVRHGAIWISNRFNDQEAEESILYRVDDILVDGDYQALIDLVQNQTSGEWIDIDGIGGEVDPVPDGYLMITQSRRVHAETVALLAQLRQSFVMPAPADPNEVEIRAYVMTEAMANDLREILPQLIEPDTWADSADADSSKVGQIHILHRDDETTLLVIRHTRAVHAEFIKVVKEIDPMLHSQLIHHWHWGGGFSSVMPEE